MQFQKWGFNGRDPSSLKAGNGIRTLRPSQMGSLKRNRVEFQGHPLLQTPTKDVKVLLATVARLCDWSDASEDALQAPVIRSAIVQGPLLSVTDATLALILTIIAPFHVRIRQ